MTDAFSPAVPDPYTPGAAPPVSVGDPLGSKDDSLLEWGERKAASFAVGRAQDEFNLMPRGSAERLEGSLALSDLDREIRATGDHKFSISPHIDPYAIADLFDRHSSSDSDKEAAKSGTTSHYLSLEFSDMTWGDFQTKLGSTSILSDATVSLTPDQSGTPLQVGVHADLIRQHWADIGGVKLTTDVQGTLTYTDHKGVGGTLDLRQDLTFQSLSIEAVISTDLRTGETTFVGALKWTF